MCVIVSDLLSASRMAWKGLYDLDILRIGELVFFEERDKHTLYDI